MPTGSRHPVLRLDLRTVRVRIPTRDAPYWQRIGKGRALGYRKRRKEEPGTWFVRRFDASASQRMLHHVIGLADDQEEANRRTVFSYEQALDAAQAWFKRPEKQRRGRRFTVADAIDAYFAHCTVRGVKGMERMRSAAKAHIVPSLGNLAVDKLDRQRLEEWRDALANSSRRLRTRSGQRQRFAPAPSTEEQRTRRRDTANRIFTVLRAALNYAVDRKHASLDVAAEWREVKAFRNVGRVRLRFLSDNEQSRLTSACEEEDFNKLVRAGLFTGARFGELSRLEVRDFDPVTRKVFIAFSKAGKSRHVLLTPEALKFFSRLCNGRDGAELMLARNVSDAGERGPWQNRPAQRLLKAAWKAAKIPPVTFHELRHTTASTWIRLGVPLTLVSEQLGHSSIAITVKYYGHLAEDWKTGIFDKLPSLEDRVRPDGSGLTQ